MRALLIRNLPYLLLILASIIFIAWELARFWLRRHIVRDHTCPNCHGEDFYRVHRHLYERLFGVGMNIRRYRCANPNCNWEGLRRHHKHASPAVG